MLLIQRCLEYLAFFVDLLLKTWLTTICIFSTKISLKLFSNHIVENFKFISFSRTVSTIWHWNRLIVYDFVWCGRVFLVVWTNEWMWCILMNFRKFWYGLTFQYLQLFVLLRKSLYFDFFMQPQRFQLNFSFQISYFLSEVFASNFNQVEIASCLKFFLMTFRRG